MTSLSDDIIKRILSPSGVRKLEQHRLNMAKISKNEVPKNEIKPKLAPPWQYPITAQLAVPYSYANGQSLMELSRRVTRHNEDPIAVPLDPPNFDPTKTVSLDIPVFGNICWLFYSPSLDIVLIVFTGTYNTELEFADILYNQVLANALMHYVTNMKVHIGFLSLYLGVQVGIVNYLNQNVTATTQVIVTGHSLGGAEGTICMIDLFQRLLPNSVTINNIIHYSFASPRVWNTIGATQYNSLAMASYRIFNDSDIIITLPLPVMPNPISPGDPTLDQDFTHFDNFVYFNINLGGLVLNHSEAYLQYYAITPV